MLSFEYSMTVTLHRGIILLPWVGGVPSSAIILALISKSNSKSVVGLSPQEQFDDYYSDVISFFFLINSVCKNCLKDVHNFIFKLIIYPCWNKRWAGPYGQCCIGFKNSYPYISAFICFHADHSTFSLFFPSFF